MGQAFDGIWRRLSTSWPAVDGISTPAAGVRAARLYRRARETGDPGRCRGEFVRLGAQAAARSEWAALCGPLTGLQGAKCAVRHTAHVGRSRAISIEEGKVKRLINRWLSVLAVAMVAMPMLAPGTVSAQGDSRTFTETGKTVRATFLAYWNGHGGLAQQGFPISDEMQEVSDTDGKTYTVQYFERAVFELHPEFAGTPNEVLLSLLGVFLYKQKYTAIDGAPAQQPNNEAGSVVFNETGKRVGGKFLAYWQTHGGLAQQGLPISDEFIEVNDLDGKPYRVQYFERAVFEIHPEFAGTPNEVLLSQLGTFRYRQKYLTPATPTAAPATPPVVVPTPTTPPAATQPPASTPVPDDPCAGIPASTNATPSPACGTPGTNFSFTGRGFQPGENVGVYATRPDGSVNGAPFQVEADSAGNVGGVTLRTTSTSPTGIWAMTFEGTSSHARAIAYFKLVSQTGGPPPTSTCDTSGNRNGSATPSSGRPGTTIMVRATGFRTDEAISFWFTLPDGSVAGTAEPLPPGLVNPDGSIGPLPIEIDAAMAALAEGRWAITFQGASSGNIAVIYFCVQR
jgi:hypothetical protein